MCITKTNAKTSKCTYRPVRYGGTRKRREDLAQANYKRATWLFGVKPNTLPDRGPRRNTTTELPGRLTTALSKLKWSSFVIVAYVLEFNSFTHVAYRSITGQFRARSDGEKSQNSTTSCRKASRLVLATSDLLSQSGTQNSNTDIHHIPSPQLYLLTWWNGPSTNHRKYFTLYPWLQASGQKNKT